MTMTTLADVPPRDAGRWLTPPMAVTAVVLTTLPLWITHVGLYDYLGLEVAIWMIYALGFNLLFGYAGLHSFGHGAYLGIGAYGFGLFQQHFGPALWSGLLAAVALAAVAGVIVGLFVSHRRGIYFSLLTIAFGQVAWFVAMKWHGLTGGEDGMLNIPRPRLDLGFAAVSLADNRTFYLFVVALLAAVVVLLWRVVNSPFGRILQAIRQNELRAAFVGYAVWRFKLAAFVLSAGIAGLAGALLAMAQESAYPDVMSLHQSGLVVMMALIGGGLVSFWGPILGVALFFVARDVLGAVTEAWLFWFGLMFMAMVLFRPEGIAGVLSGLGRRLAARPRADGMRAAP